MKDKSIIDAIASLRADLDKLEARVKEEDFVPGRYILDFDDKNGIKVRRIKKSGEIVEVYEPGFTMSNGFRCKCNIFPKPPTRYNWPWIIKQYPEAQWASTDADGRVDAWSEKPKEGCCSEDEKWLGCGCKSNCDSGHKHVGHTKDWADSLEKRPDYL